jgi:outer membrane receptor protein involved in Fe transport
MHKKTHLALACTLALVAPGAVLAQQTPAAPLQATEPEKAVAPPAASASAAAAPPAVQTLERVTVVTSSKRKERLQDAPTAITALSGGTLDKLGVAQFSDYVSLVPNMSQASGGTPGFGTIILRGLYTGSQQTTNTSAVYLGESPFTASGSLSVGALVTPDPDLVDVDRIEVLKGPQGTLFGASSLGGLVRIIPRDPDLTAFSGSVRLDASKVDHGGDGYGARVSLNMPLSSSFGVRLGVFKRRDAGFVRNLQTGSDNGGQSDTEGGSVTALAQVSRDWKATLRLLTQDTNSVGSAGQDNVQLTDTPVTRDREARAFTDGPSQIRYRLAEFSTEYAMNLGTVTATVSHAESRARLQADYTPSYGPLFAAFLPPGSAIIGDLDVNMKSKTTAEVRFSTKRLGSFEGLAGVFYTDEKNDYGANITATLPTGPVAPPFGNILTSDTASTYREEALFANGTYYLTNDLDFGAGLRYARNTQHAVLQGTGLLSSSPDPTLFDFSDAATTYQLTGRWRPSRDLSTFVRYATGYRPGGPQTNSAPPPGAQTSIRPDKVANIELGVKGAALDRRLTFDASIYRIDWKDVQLNGLFGGRVLLANAGRAKVDGFETQLQYNADNGLSFGANLGYNDAKLTEVDASTAAVLGARVGDRLPGSPRLTAALFADWRFPVAEAMIASVGATVRYQGDKVSSYSDSTLNPLFNIPSYTTLDLRAALEWSRYTLRLRVDNATDVNGYTGYSTNRVLPTQTTIPSNVSITRPRTVSLAFGVDF